MNITYFIDTIIPSEKANTVHVMRMCQAFTQLGLSVTLVCERKEARESSLDSVWDKYGITNHFKIERVYVPSLLQKYGHRIGADYGSWLKSRVTLDSSLFYSRSSTTLFFLKKKGKYIFEAHMEPDRINKHIIGTVIKHKNCVRIVTISESLKQRYLELYPTISDEKITVLHDCADIPIPSSETIELKGKQGKIKIGYLGHLYPGKCMETVIPLAKRFPDQEFHIVGGTEYWVDYWKNRLLNEDIKNIFLYGYVNNSEIGKYYRAFDLCILPFSENIHIGKNKRTDIGKWISPLKLFEAMSFSKPIIVSKLPSIEEVMEDKVDCLLAKPDDCDDWSRILSYALEHPEEMQRMGKKAFEKLSNEYTWSKRAQRIVNMFEEKE